MGSPPVALAVIIFCLEGVSEPEIGLYKVVRSPIDKVVTGFAEKADGLPAVGALDQHLYSN